MGKIINRVRERNAQAEAKRRFDESPFGRILAAERANPGGTIKFRRWPAYSPPARGGDSIQEPAADDITHTVAEAPPPTWQPAPPAGPAPTALPLEPANPRP